MADQGESAEQQKENMDRESVDAADNASGNPCPVTPKAAIGMPMASEFDLQTPRVSVSS